MIRSGRLRRLTLALLAAPSLWGLPGAAVLCIAPGAHVAIEAGTVVCAVGEPIGQEPVPAQTPTVGDPASCCAPCTDFPLHSSAVQLRAAGHQINQLVTGLAFAPAGALPLDDVRARAGGPRHPGAMAHLLPIPPLHTIVLRC